VDETLNGVSPETIHALLEFLWDMVQVSVGSDDYVILTYYFHYFDDSMTFFGAADRTNHYTFLLAGSAVPDFQTNAQFEAWVGGTFGGEPNLETPTGAFAPGQNIPLTNVNWDSIVDNPDGPTNGDDVLTGTESPDVIDALDGNDAVTGLGVNDTLNGNAGADNLSGGTGNDTLRGGAGDDTFVFTAGQDIVIDFGTGNVNDVVDSVWGGGDRRFCGSRTQSPHTGERRGNSYRPSRQYLDIPRHYLACRVRPGRFHLLKESVDIVSCVRGPARLGLSEPRRIRSCCTAQKAD